MSDTMSDTKSVAISRIIRSHPEKSDKTRWTVEEALATRVNTWKGWRCAAGTENLHITPDGNMYSATCKVGGLLGNVFEGTFNIPKEWIVCTKDWCMCGADMQIRKAKDLELVVQTRQPLVPDSQAETNHNEDTRIKEALESNLVGPAFHEIHLSYPKTITWDLSRRCNYSCSYCHPSVSNNYESHHSKQSLFVAIERIDEMFCKGEKTKWVFTGGEPTLNPAIMDVVDKVNSYGHLVHIQSNGSRGPLFFKELIQKACVGLSLHFEGGATERFIETCRAIVDQKSIDERARVMWFGVRVMVGPGRIEEALRTKKELLKIPGFMEHGNINFSPLYKRFKQDELMEYDKAEFLEIIKNA